MTSTLKFPGQRLQDEDVASQSVERHFAKQLATLDATTRLALKLLEKNNSIIVPRALKETPRVVMALYGKLLKTVRAIRVAASLSLVEDAQVLCRTMAETAVAIRYLLQKKSGHRTDEYLAHTLMRTKDVMAKWAKAKGLKRLGRVIDKKIDAYLAPYAYLGSPRLKELRRYYYGARPLREVFKEVGLEKLYLVAYLQFTGIHHVSDAERHVRVAERGGIGVLLGSSDEGQMNVLLHTTNALLWLTTARVSRKFKLGYQAEIEAIKPERRGDEALRAWRRRKRARSKS